LQGVADLIGLNGVEEEEDEETDAHMTISIQNTIVV